MQSWQKIPWIINFAEHFKISVQDIKLLFEIFCGNHANEWTHPFGELASWVDKWETEESWKIRDRIINERNWDWDKSGGKIIMNEIYRRTSEATATFDDLKPFIAEHQKRAGREISILDYGCGTANFAEHIIDLPGLRFCLADVDPFIVSYCRHKFRDYSSRVKSDIIPTRKKYQGDACRVATARKTIHGKYDIIYSIDVLEHTLNPLRTMIQMTKALPEGGLLIFHFPDSIE